MPIQDNHCLPLPSRPPRPAPNKGRNSFRVPPSAAWTIPVRTGTTRRPAAAAGAANISDEIGCTFTGSDVPKSGELDVMYMHGHKDALVDFANAEVLRDAVIAVYGAEDKQVIASDATFTRTRYTNARGIRFEFIEHDYVSDSEVGVPPIGCVSLKTARIVDALFSAGAIATLAVSCRHAPGASPVAFTCG